MNAISELTGTQVNYYFICKRKLWLHSRNISFESSSDLVKLGNLIHKNSYKRKKKEIRIGNISIDYINKGQIHEVKKSDKIHEAHTYQILYYMYYLKNLGVETTGVLEYPSMKKTVNIILTPQKQDFIDETIRDATQIISREKPPVAEYKPICDKCAYAEYCWS